LKISQKISLPVSRTATSSKLSTYNVVREPKNKRIAARQEARLKSTVLTEEKLGRYLSYN